jgi:hypothetical protein
MCAHVFVISAAAAIFQAHYFKILVVRKCDQIVVLYKPRYNPKIRQEEKTHFEEVIVRTC